MILTPGQTVRHLQHGWGKVIRADEAYTTIKFDQAGFVLLKTAELPNAWGEEETAERWRLMQRRGCESRRNRLTCVGKKGSKWRVLKRNAPGAPWKWVGVFATKAEAERALT